MFIEQCLFLQPTVDISFFLIQSFFVRGENGNLGSHICHVIMKFSVLITQYFILLKHSILSLGPCSISTFTNHIEFQTLQAVSLDIPNGQQKNRIWSMVRAKCQESQIWGFGTRVQNSLPHRQSTSFSLVVWLLFYAYYIDRGTCFSLMSMSDMFSYRLCKEIFTCMSCLSLDSRLSSL